jgi:hypothetical protein
MMRNLRKIILFISFFILAQNIFPQNETGTISGNVKDIDSKQPIAGANVILLGTKQGATTDVEGNFTIPEVPVNVYRVKASIIGYASVTKTDIEVMMSKPSYVDFDLNEEPIQLNDITVKSEYFTKTPTELISTTSFGYEEIRRSPGGFEDVVRALSVLPGVAQADAGRNDLIVRGGAPSENLYIVDGMEIPNINHFGTQGAAGGPLSYINLDFVKETSFSAGGFSAEYGDRLSSVLKIDLRNGRSDKLGGKATIAASQFGLNLEGPLGENKDFLFSVRRSYLDFIFKAAGFGFVPEYYDMLTKANYKLDNNNKLSFLFIGALDNVKYFNETADKRLDNARILGSDQVQYAAGLFFQHLISNGFINLTLNRNYTDYKTEQRDTLLNPIFKDYSTETENSFKADLVYKFSVYSEISVGLACKNILFKSDILFPDFVTTFGDTLPVNGLTSRNMFTKASGYVNLNYLFFGRLRTNFGLRLDYFDYLEKKIYPAPRFSITYLLDNLTNINLSTGSYYQAPSYIWLAAAENNKRLTDIRTDQLIVGFDRLLGEDFLLKIETYYKWYNDYPASLIRPYLVLANTGAGYNGADDNFSSFGLEPLTSGGSGKSRGVELSLQKKLSDIRCYGILSLTYSKTDFTALDNTARNGAYDQRWIFNLAGGYKFDENWEAGFKFRYASGRPYTPFTNSGFQLVSDYLSNYFKALHSLDIRVDKRWFYEKFTLITYIDIQNIYNNKYSNSLRWDPRTRMAVNDPSIGILPSIGISLEF